MTAPFLPLAFTARNGAVLFEGRPLPDFRAIALRHRLTSKALDADMSERAAGVFWALREARQQRRCSFRVVSTNTPHRAARA